MSPKGEQFKGKANTERSMDDNNIALLARKMSEFLRRTCSAVYKGKMAVILIGQARTGGIGGFATHEELTGGRATKFYSLLTVNMRKGQGVDSPVISEKKEVIEINEEGDKVKVKKVVKTKIGFDAVLTINKTKKSHSQPELSTLHIPYYYASGFIKE
jgi:recombination protein RecA